MTAVKKMTHPVTGYKKNYKEEVVILDLIDTIKAKYATIDIDKEIDKWILGEYDE